MKQQLSSSLAPQPLVLPLALPLLGLELGLELVLGLLATTRPLPLA